MEYSRQTIEKIKADAIKGKFPIPENMLRATAALFWEHRLTSRTSKRGAKPVYNLSLRDHDGTLSMYQIYMQCATEYEAGLVLLGTTQHWRQLCACKWFVPHIEAWREEMALRDAALGRQALLEASAKGNYAAGKALIAATKVPKAVKVKPGADGYDNAKPKPKEGEELVFTIAERTQQLKEGLVHGTKSG